MITKVLEARLEELKSRPNNTYNRGILHGFLLALTTEERLGNFEAINILDEFRAKEEG